MSFTGRVAVWGPARVTDGDIEGDTVEINRWLGQSRPVYTGTRLTPLNRMTGSRIAASGNGVVRWVGGDASGRPLHARSGPKLSDLRRQISAVFARQPDGPPEIRGCPRCGQGPHTEWGPEYERLVCQEITAA